MSQLIRFDRVCSHVDDIYARNKRLTAKLLKQGYRYHLRIKSLFFNLYDVMKTGGGGVAVCDSLHA